MVSARRSDAGDPASVPPGHVGAVDSKRARRGRPIPFGRPEPEGRRAPESAAPLAESSAIHHHRFARGRLAAVSVGAAMAAGAWVGFAIGLLLGGALGAVVAWLAGAILAWQQDLGLTLGVVRNLLPFGDQVPMLRTLSNYWYVVIPGIAIASGIVGAVVTALVGGLIAATYNRSPRHATVLVELPPQSEPDAAARMEGAEGGRDGEA